MPLLIPVAQAAKPVNPGQPKIAISIIVTAPLEFGRLAAAGTGGSVLVDPGGVLSSTGDVMVLSSGSGSPARFLVSGDAGWIYSISLPADGSVSLTNGNGQSMSLSGFASSPSSLGQFDGFNQQSLSVGARLQVGPQQPAGSYSGSFSVVVSYN